VRAGLVSFFNKNKPSPLPALLIHLSIIKKIDEQAESRVIIEK
jgi:hypothetical protein